MTGAVKSVRLRAVTEIKVDGGSLEIIDPNGVCLDLQDVAFDTRAPVGTACLDHKECGTTKMCSIETRTCAISECGACAAGHTCEYVRGSTAKICLRGCGFFLACGTGYDCEDHFCKHVPAADAGLGAACSNVSNDTTTQCEPGLYCDRLPPAPSPVCRKACNPIVAEPGCAASERCLPQGYCGSPLGNALAVSVGDSCALPAGSPISTLPCGDDGKSYKGTCFTKTSAVGGSKTTKCWPVCSRNGPTCAAGTYCSSALMEGAEACQPLF